MITIRSRIVGKTPTAADATANQHRIFKNLLKEMVGVTGIKPVTPSMSTKCSPAGIYIYITVFIILFIWLCECGSRCVYTMSTSASKNPVLTMPQNPTAKPDIHRLFIAV
jgi:hypothetical protein